MESFFGTPWSEFSIEDVAAFLNNAEDEGLTWEAKGTERPRPVSVRKHVSAFANTVGGFYIVGASRDGKAGPWRLDPVEFNDEPRTWLSKVIRSNLRPVPAFDVKAWEVGGKHVAVVNVEPVSEPPCVTNDGEVFARVSGESYTVKDPATLRRLMERGEARAAATEAEALRAAAVPDGAAELDPSHPSLRLRLAFAPSGRAIDVGGRLFTSTFCERMMAAADRLPTAPLYPYEGGQKFAIRTTQDALTLRQPTQGNRQRWALRASWDGSVAIYLDVQPDPEDGARLQDIAIFANVVRPAAHAAMALVAALGGYGRAHFTLVVHARRFEIQNINGNVGKIPGPSSLLPIRAWTDDDGRLADEDLDRMRREICRASGALVWEPEEATAGSPSGHFNVQS